MKKEESTLHKFDSLTDLHRVLGLERPRHPLVSFVDLSAVRVKTDELSGSMVLNFYKIAYKTTLCGQAKYGQTRYDFSEGGLAFTAPNQVFESPDGSPATGFLLLVHPDFLLSYPLARTIRQFGFFSYEVNEALHLSEKEKSTIFAVFKIMDEELNERIDDFSQDVMNSQLELLLNYCNRFYKRQFITRKPASNDLLQKLEDILEHYFDQKSLHQGMPTVHDLADSLNVSPSYLSDMLRSLTGQNAQQHIHQKLVEKAKEILSTSSLSVAEIAYQLGFEHPQSFSRLFKTKTNLSPQAFRQSFN